MADVIIIGAGITGLSCAWRLKRMGIEPLVLEASQRPGGVIKSERVDGYLIERGPNSLLPASENFPLLDEAGLTGEIIEADPKSPRYVVIGGKLRKIPFGPLTPGGLLRAAVEPFVRSKSPKNESVHDFFARRFGRQAQDRLVAPFVTGIYAGDTTKLDMAATFPRFAELERKHGSLILGMMKSGKPKGSRRGHTCSFAGGMERLPQRLAADVDIVYDAADVRLEPGLQVKWTSGTLPAKAVIVTAPAYRAAGMIGNSIPGLATLLDKVDYAPMVTATTSVPDSAFPKPLDGFGFLIPRSEGFHLLGTLFSSALFPGRSPDGRQLLTSFVGGAHERDAIHWTDEQVMTVVRPELQRILGTSEAPLPVAVTRQPRAIPQYRIGHEDWTMALKNELKQWPGLFMAGNYMEGVAVAACMETGERVAREAAAFIGSRA